LQIEIERAGVRYEHKSGGRAPWRLAGCHDEQGKRHGKALAISSNANGGYAQSVAAVEVWGGDTVSPDWPD